MTRSIGAERPPALSRSIVLGNGEKTPRPFPIGIFFLALTGSMSRGLFELVVGKTAAYAIQAALLGLLVLALIWLGRPRSTSLLSWSFMTLLAFAVVALLSLFVTAANSGDESAVIYVVVMTFIASLLVVFNSIEFRFSRTERIGPVVVFVVLLSVIVAVLQQFAGFTLLPGSDTGTFAGAVRPAALTGSFLHYPIALAILAFVLLGIFAKRRHWIYAATAVIAMIAVLATYSRSGMVLVLTGIAVGLLTSTSVHARLRLLFGLLLGAVAFVIAVPTTEFFDRLFSIFDVDGAGNQTRLRAWSGVTDLWLESPLFIGAHTGRYSNITQNLSEVEAAGVAESSVLQLMINFGLLGAITFYLLMMITIKASPAVTPWYRAGLVAALVQSVVYQSVEVLPFMAVFALVPFIGQQIEASDAPIRAPDRARRAPRNAGVVQ